MLGKLQPAERRAFAFMGEDIMQNGFAHKLAFPSVQSVPCGNSSCSLGPFRVLGAGVYDEPCSIRDLMYPFHGVVVCMVKIKIAGDKVEGCGRFDCKRVSGLACLAAPIDLWFDFERDWGRVLEHHGRKRSHMSEDHWDDAFTTDRLRLVQSFINDTERVCAAISVVRLDDYETAAKAHPVKIPTHTCLNIYWCLDQIYKQFPKGRVGFAFDRGESFFDEINRHWQRKNLARRNPTLSRISTLVKADNLCSYSLQAADFLAWEINRQRTDLPWGKAGSIEDAMAQLPAHDPNDKAKFEKYKSHSEGLALLMTTRNRLWVREDFEYYVQCAQGQHGDEGRKFIAPFSLCT